MTDTTAEQERASIVDDWMNDIACGIFITKNGKRISPHDFFISPVIFDETLDAIESGDHHKIIP
jgi:hypothetical protein